jgi:hypothetical protein
MSTENEIVKQGYTLKTGHSEVSILKLFLTSLLCNRVYLEFKKFRKEGQLNEKAFFNFSVKSIGKRPAVWLGQASTGASNSGASSL